MEHKQRGVLRFLWILPVIAILLIIAAKNEDSDVKKVTTVTYTHTACSGNVERLLDASWSVIDVPPRCDARLWRNPQDKIDVKTFPGGKLYPAGTRSKNMYITPVEKIMLRSVTGQTARVRVIFHPLGTLNSKKR